MGIGKLSHSIKLSDIDFSGGDNVDALYLTGGRGTATDFIENDALKSAVETLLANDKIVAAICHGVLGLVQCTAPDGSAPLVAGKTVTGFTDSEEEVVQLTKVVPFLLETKLKEQGAKIVVIGRLMFVWMAN